MEVTDFKSEVSDFKSEVTDFKSEVRFDLQGCLEALVASEAIIWDHISNMNMDMLVVEVD